MKLLIFGADSPLGQALLEQLQERGVDYCIPAPDEFSITDPVSVARIVTRLAPDQLVNLACYAAGHQLAVAQAEQNPQDCEAVNHDQAAVLAQVCDHLNIPLVHLSSAHVFSGEKKLAYTEQDTPKPLSVYGKTALQGEQAIIDTADKHVILRAGWLFGAGQDQALRGWLDQVKANDGAVSVVRRRFSPTPVEDLARVLVAVSLQIDCQADVWGVYHYCGLESPRESEFVQHLVKLAAQHDEAMYKLLDHLDINLTRAQAPDATNVALATKKIFETFGIKQRSWHGSLQRLVKSYYV